MVKRTRKAVAAKVGIIRGAAADPTEDTEDVLDRICTTLATAISGGALKPGSKILDDVIAGHFGVSRTVVRGALDILQRDHLVERLLDQELLYREISIAAHTPPSPRALLWLSLPGDGHPAFSPR